MIFWVLDLCYAHFKHIATSNCHKTTEEAPNMDDIFQCALKITTSEHDSWQGTLRFEGIDYQFHSEIELLRLIEELLHQNT